MTGLSDSNPSKRSRAKVQVLSCRCICRTYDGKFVVVNADCTRHRVHPDFTDQNPSKRPYA